MSRTAESARHAIRALLPVALSRIPRFRGKGRITLLLDWVLTDACDPRSYRVVGNLYDRLVLFDLRAFGEKFVYYYRDYELNYVAVARSLYRGGNFLDVGSSVGLFLLGMASAVRGCRGRLFSVEPVPAHLARQKENIALNGLEEFVEYAPVAVGATAGVVRMSVDERGITTNAAVSREGTLEVPVVTLDALCRERAWRDIGLIKMDIEGFEPQAIAGAIDLLTRDRPVLFAEFYRARMDINGTSMERPWQLLMDLGYRAFRVVGGRPMAIEAPGLHENLFFVPAGHPTLV